MTPLERLNVAILAMPEGGEEKAVDHIRLAIGHCAYLSDFMKNRAYTWLADQLETSSC